MIGEAAAQAQSEIGRLAGDHGRLAPAAADVAYRVVQEALTNALKHAGGGLRRH